MGTRKMRTVALGTILGCGLAGSIGGTAFADSTDNLVPTGSYHAPCTKGGAGYGPVCLTDNSKVYYYMDSGGAGELESVDRQIVSSMLSAQYSPTHLQIHYDSTPVFSGSGETDIVYQEGDLPSPYIGYTWCDDPVATYVCDQTVVRMQGAGTISPGLSCHETGHAVGLTHGSEAYPRRDNNASVLGCMQGDYAYYQDLGANQVRNINSYYPLP